MPSVSYRAPGVEINTPHISISNSTISKKGVFYYFKVKSEENNLTWYVMREFGLEAGEKELKEALQGVTENSGMLNTFINTYTVREVYKRSNYLVYKNKIVLIKFIGKHLTVLERNLIKSAILIEEIKSNKEEKCFIVNREHEFKCSCLQEKEEWMKIIRDIINK
ncbi:hypothetical protein NUSPORA_02112 [Nucleospora cyclopteri]